MYMTSAALREAFLEFFRTKGHQLVASSSLVPHDDPTLLFTNAGMNQFKDAFLGKEQRSYTRAASSQRCVRAGGKHNDLENVGYTARHHTFFEMLGNFSFGDYFKRDAICFAWEFLTDTLKLPKERLLVTIYETDDEAFELWANEIGVPADRIVRIGDKSADKKFESDNFWQMGDTGPCGPCTEIFYDHGEHIWGGPPGSPEEDGDRFIEIWNVVFMQFNRQSDGTMEPLPNPSVDTGMGLERIAAILQGVHSNYEIDIFQTLIKHAAQIIGTTDLEDKSLRVIADHIRSCSFLIADGVMPSNEGRGYVLRRIIRRAVRHGHKLGATGVFFHRLVPVLANEMGAAFDELNSQLPIIEKVLKVEEEQFARTLDRGLQILDDELAALQGDVVPGELVFKLYDTYGFPADLTADIARERSLTIDQAGFDVEMAAQRKRAQSASNFDKDYNADLNISHCTEFVGYDNLTMNSKVIEILTKAGESVKKLKAGEEGIVILDNTPFYGESGGQKGDIGSLRMNDGAFAVTDTQKSSKAIVHNGYVEFGEIYVGEELTADVDERHRKTTALNHSATHLLHAALRQVLGEHVQQKGSLVGPERLRFDFSHFESLSIGTLRQIEHLVNQQIRRNNPVTTQLMNLDEAKSAGAMALFGEKYEDDVRVVGMGEFSTELCGGTHVERTGDIGFFKITTEAGIAAGVRRIEAVTGQAAIDMMHAIGKQMEEMSTLVKGDNHSIADRVRQTVDRMRSLEKEVEQLKAELAKHKGASLTDETIDIKGVKVLVSQLDGADPKSLRGMVDDLKNRLGSGVVVLGVPGDGKVSLIVGVTKDLTGKVKAGELVNMVAQQVGGKGGGRPDMAQAGGSDAAALPAALASVSPWLTERL
ncbi:alanine--tRNA ligase [Corallincola spongiicola]|uniref:Alanine--tRNA ligase n=1 Tax=Corallincola spongiicola TaxID=2520508 RepID=A0ABY1WRL0_9GAMM|nr:alanine--tRNA ligase [Corallincola spongiicola]TAA47372.1 alanine--tRNA ligase [Corallincola spongiicola]